MKRACLVVLSALLLSACGGPSSEGQGVKTPDELLAEQERLADEQDRERQKHASGSTEETDLEKKAKFDKRQADLELKRAARSAETCPGSVPEESPAGTAKVTVVFGPDGNAKSATITAPYDENAVGKCAINAFNSVIVPPFEGADETIEWEITFPEQEKKDPKKDPKKKGK